jgi:hypothetical protein
MKMEKSKDRKLDRRSVLGKLFSLPVGAVLATSAVQADENTLPKMAKAPARLVDHGLNRAEVLEAARANLGLYGESDIAAKSTSYARIGDSLSGGLSADELPKYAMQFKIYASNTVLELMETGAYSDQSMVDMKFIYIPAAQELDNTVNAFGEGQTDLESAKLEIRATFGRFLASLEQIPAN